MCDIDLEPCEVWRETRRRARKAHRCSCCRVEIPAGEMYCDHFSVYEGDGRREKLCLVCHADRERFADAHGGMICMPDHLPDMLADCIAEGDEESEQMWKPMLDRINRERRQSVPTTAP